MCDISCLTVLNNRIKQINDLQRHVDLQTKLIEELSARIKGYRNELAEADERILELSRRTAA
jgi:peptidoglycan hydrolase CwlO-like protein